MIHGRGFLRSTYIWYSRLFDSIQISLEAPIGMDAVNNAQPQYRKEDKALHDSCLFDSFVSPLGCRSPTRKRLLQWQLQSISKQYEVGYVEIKRGLYAHLLYDSQNVMEFSALWLLHSDIHETIVAGYSSFRSNILARRDLLNCQIREKSVASRARLMLLS